MILPDVPQGTDPNVLVPLDNLSEAKLVMTDKLMKLALKAQPDNVVDLAEDLPLPEVNREHLQRKRQRGLQALLQYVANGLRRYGWCLFHISGFAGM